VPVRSHAQSVHLYGVNNARPVIVSSGDGGWIHLGSHVAELLAAHGCFVVGFDVKAYLTSFTTTTSTLHADDEPSDVRTISDYASQFSHSKPILIGISEGAGLSVLAAADPITRQSIRGVIGIGLPDRNELGWRWKDSIIYLTHGVPKEPTFNASALIDKVSPLPLALLHSTHDEFAPLADARRMMQLGAEPKRLWVVGASIIGSATTSPGLTGASSRRSTGSTRTSQRQGLESFFERDEALGWFDSVFLARFTRRGRLCGGTASASVSDRAA
jgi:pimeloyl-ACP methyl ester carboxylesterase